MTTLQRVSLAVGGIAVAVVLCLLANHWLKPRIFSPQSEQQASTLYHATATVERAERNADGIRVCYSVSSFTDLPAADRSFYQTTEAARAAGHGPRCLTTQSAAAEGVQPGSSLDMYFTLLNGGKIAIVRVAAAGNNL